MNMKDLEILMTLFHRVLTGYQVVIDKSKRTTIISVEVKEDRS